ncbi:hypothetical protein GCM10022631_14350 [Deinococcus rubellus]
MLPSPCCKVGQGSASTLASCAGQDLEKRVSSVGVLQDDQTHIELIAQFVELPPGTDGKEQCNGLLLSSHFSQISGMVNGIKTPDQVRCPVTIRPPHRLCPSRAGHTANRQPETQDEILIPN